MSDIKEYIDLVKENEDNPVALLVGVLLLFTLLFLPFHNFSASLISIFCIIFFIIAWWWMVNQMPKNRKKVGVLLSILGDNKEVDKKIKTDFVGEIEKNLAQNKIADSVNILYLSNKRAIKINAKLNEYKRLKEEIESKKIKTADLTKEQKRRMQKWEKFIKKANYHFFIWGSANEDEREYRLSLNGLVLHDKIHPITQSLVKTELNNIFLQNIRIDKKIRYDALVFSARHFSIVIKYITGIAAFVSNKIDLAHDLHSDLLKELENNPGLPPQITILKDKMKEFLAQELFRQAIEKQKTDLKSALGLVDQSLVYNSENFFSLNLKSFLEFLVNKDIEEALKYANISSQFSQGELTWAYNKGFLLMYSGRFKEALKVYKMITKTRCVGEESLINSVVDFNKNLFASEPDKYQCLFIIGYILCKKHSLISGYTYLKEFAKKTKNKEKYEDMNNVAKAYIERAEKMIGKN